MAYDKTNLFARILRGEIPCSKVYEDAHVLAFRDIHPKAPVHILVVPKGDYVSLQDFSAQASEDEITAFYRAVSKITAAEGLDSGGFRAIANAGLHGGQEVPHFHLHILGGGELGPMISRP